VNIEEKKRLVLKAKRILNQETYPNLKIKPFNKTKIKRARDWFGNDEKVQDVISKHLNIPK